MKKEGFTALNFRQKGGGLGVVWSAQLLHLQIHRNVKNLS
jgi:hypothetical protein